MDVTAIEFIEQGSGIVTLCGSTRFFFEAMEANKMLTFNNWIVLMCGSWGHSFHKFRQDVIKRDYKQVKKLHYQKILMSDCIVICFDDSRYMGESTQAEKAFAFYRNIPVFYWDGVMLSGETDKPVPNLLSDESLILKFKKEYGTLGF